MPGLPGVKVELDDGSGSFPYDISAYCDLSEGVQITRGRRDQQAQVEPSTAVATFSNRDGRFTIGSPVYGIKVDQKIRYSWVLAGVTYRRFTGWIQAFPTTWPTGPGVAAWTTITAVDDMPRWSRRDVRERVQAFLLAQLGTASSYWPLSEPAGATQAQPLRGTSLLSQRAGSAPPSFGATGVPAGSPITSMASTGYLDARVPEYRLLGRPQVAIGCFLQTTTANQTLIIDATTRYGDAVIMAVDSAGRLTVRWRQTGSADQVCTGPVVTDGVPHYVHARVTGGGIKLYVDGAVATLTSVLNFTGPADTHMLTVQGDATRAHLYRARADIRTPGTAGTGGGDFSDADVAALLALVTVTYLRADLQLARVLEQTSGSVLGSVEPGTQQVRSDNVISRKVADGVAEVVDAEGGLVFVAADGTVSFQNGNHRSRQKSVLTFGVEAADPGSDFDVVFDMDDVVNAWSGSRVVGDGQSAPTVVSRDEASIAAHDERPGGGQALALATDALVKDRGDWIVATKAEPRPRLPDATLDLLTSPALFQASVMGVELSSRITVAGLPAQAPVIGDSVVEGWTETLRSGSKPVWSLGFNLSAFADYVAWILEDSEFGSLDGPGRLAPGGGPALEAESLTVSADGLSATYSGPFMVDNGDGTATYTGTRFVDNGNGTATWTDA